MKRVLRSLALVAIAIVSFSAAKAQNPHFVDVKFSDLTNSVSVSGKIAGLGNSENVFITMSATVSYSFDCLNPGGKQPNPFRDIMKSETVTGNFSSDKNGNVTFSLNANKLTAAQLAAEYCPNRNWKIQNLTSPLVSATVTAQTAQGTITASYPY